MDSLKQEFIAHVIKHEALQFGNFTLKSGRISPYFFNMGNICSGASLNILGACYAEKLISLNLKYDVIYGPAYKGIPLAVATAMSVAQSVNKNAEYAFHRKESKDHGEGGDLVGANLTGNIVIVDDVITKGTDIRESLDLINKNKDARVTGIVIALDRMERGDKEITAITQIEQDYDIKVYPIITANDVFKYVSNNMSADLKSLVEQYKEEYCAL